MPFAIVDETANIVVQRSRSKTSTVDRAELPAEVRVSLDILLSTSYVDTRDGEMRKDSNQVILTS